MRIFNVNEKIQIACASENTRYGFRHVAILFLGGREADRGKVCYYNRTWESYEFESVIHTLITKTKALSTEEKEICKAYSEQIKNKRQSEVEEQFKTISNITQLGDVFCDTKKQKNEWKEKMLKAGLESKGLNFPENWDTLSEDQKAERLDGVIKIAGGD